jgi:citronellol/citronellal dehydrogenase
MPAASDLFRAGLLDGVAVALAGPARPEVAATLAALGADAREVEVASDEEAPPEAADVHALVFDAAAPFAAGGAPGASADELAPLRAAGDAAWIATRAVANAAWIEPKAPGGKVVLIAPRPGDGIHAAAARAALENLSRTLSIEWSRYGIRTTTITPADATSDADVANLVAYLVSRAGDYFSGARLDLRR